MNRALVIGLTLIIAGILIWAIRSDDRVDDAPKRIASTGGQVTRDASASAPTPVPESPSTERTETEPGAALSEQRAELEPGKPEPEPVPPLSLRGLVRSKAGEPIPGADVLLVAEAPVTAVVRSASTSADGTFRIESPPSEGRWALLAVAPGFARGGVTDLDAAEFSAPVDVVLLSEAAITGRVLENLTGKPIPDATVAARLGQSVSPLDRLWATVRPFVAGSDAGGRYHLAGMRPESRWDLVGSSPVHLPRQRVDVPAGSGNVDFVLDRGGTIHGTAVAQNTGRGVRGTRVTAWMPASPEGRREVAANVDGGFIIQGLPFGDYLVYAESPPLSSHPRPDRGQPATLSVDRPERELTLFLKPWPVGVLAGTVRDTGGSGVSDATVEVRELPGHDLRYRAGTDPWGRYRIEGIYGGDYRVVPRAENLYTDERGLRMQDGEKREDFDFVMVPGFTISGRVTLADEKTGVAGTTIGAGGRRWTSFPDAVSAPDGTYTFGPVPAGDHVLRAQPPEGYVTREEARQVAVTDSPVEDVNFIVAEGGSISGEVVSATGPVEGAEVSLATALETPERIPTYTGATRTDLDGAYTLRGVPEELSYSLVVLAAGYAGYVSPVETMRTAEPVEHPTVRLETPGATILGRAFMANGSSPPPFGVSARMSDWEGRYRRGSRWQPSVVERGTRVGADGLFTLAGPETGTWQVSLRTPPFMDVEPQTVDLPPNGEASVEFIIGASSEGTAVISGRVRFADGSPAVGYRVQASAFRERDFSGGVTDAEGYFRFEGMTDGREYRLEARPPESGFWFSGTGPTARVIAPAEGVELVIEIPGTLTGRVTDLDGGLVSNYAIQVDVEGRRRFRRGPGTLGTIDTMAGVYVVRDLSPGRYRVVGYAPERAPAESNWVDVEPARITDGADLVFDPGATLRGRVLEEGTEQPVPGTHVFTSARAWSRGMTEDFVERSTYTDAEGRFVLEHVARGSIWLIADHGLYADEFRRDVEIPAEGGPEEVTIYLTLGGTIEGDVLDIAGIGIPGQEVEIRRRRRWDRNVAVTDSAGHFQLNRLPPGEYSVEWRSHHQHVEVENGSTASVLIQEATDAER